MVIVSISSIRNFICCSTLSCGDFLLIVNFYKLQPTTSFLNVNLFKYTLALKLPFAQFDSLFWL